MRAHLSRRYHFSSSHRLHADSMSDEANQATFGKCNNPFGHGHNYVLEVCFSGAVDAVTGMVTNLEDLDRFAEERLLARFHQVNLNTLVVFKELVPTTENLAVEVHRIFAEYPHARLERVHIEETSNNSFDYFGAKQRANAARV